jgi:DNA-binding transcriptional ArsR family regulator
VENAGAVILFENEMIETFLDEKDEEFKKFLEMKLKNPDLPETSPIYTVEIKGEKISGLIGLKFSQKVEDENLKIITAVLSSIPKIYEFQKTQEEKIKDELQKILEELETGIAILHKLDRKILLSNKKYHHIIENIEKIKEIVMSELNFLSVFGIQGFKKLNLAEKNISIYTKPLQDDKIIVEIQEITKEEEESTERMLLKIQLIRKIINLILNISEKELEAEKTQKITSTLLSLLERSIREEPFTPEELKEVVLPLQNKFEGKLDMDSAIENEKSLPKNFLLIFIFIISNLIKISIETREKCRAKMKIGQISDEISVECELQQEGRRSKIKFVEDELDEIIDKLGGSISILKDKNEMKVSISIPKIE